jgi:membrane-bound lytic murein transglycosylase B
MMTKPNRRRWLSGTLALAALLAGAGNALAQSTRTAFPQWVASFRPRALARGISAATYDRVMGNLKPDMTVFALQRSQPEFREQLWQYINRRVSDWRITTGREKAQEYAALLARVEQDYGVDRYLLLALWGVESAYGDPLVQKNHMRPVFPALAALAWGEPRRRKYWETELLNALVCGRSSGPRKRRSRARRSSWSFQAQRSGKGLVPRSPFATSLSTSGRAKSSS